MLHGAYGEDGTIQGMLEMAGIPYVGANVFASAAGMDKEFTKKLAAAEGIPVGPYAVLRAGVSLSEADKERLGLPVFVKPSRAGSSHGITKVTDWAELDEAVADGPRRSTRRCWSRRPSWAARSSAGCSRARPAARPRRPCSPRSMVDATGDEFYDFEAKYLGGARRYDDPGRPDRRGHPPGPGVRAAAPSPRWTAPAWPGSTSSSRPTTRSTSTRSTRCRASRRRRCSR